VSAQRSADASSRRPNFGKTRQEGVVAAVMLAVFTYFRVNLNDFIAGRRGGAYVDPDFWPGWLLNVAILFSVLYLVKMLRLALQERSAGAAPRTATRANEAPPVQTTAATTGDGDEEEHVHEVAVSGNLVKLLVGFLLLWAYIYVMRFVGFVPSTAVFSVAFLLFVGERRWPVVVGFPVALVGVLLYTLTRLLVVPPPRGSGFFLELSTYFY
jgi:hypothetical protein